VPPTLIEPTMATHPNPLRSCPRCGYHGEGLAYFERGLNLALLIVLVVMTSWAFGIAGIVYYLLRRNHESCPRCGRGWGRFGELASIESPRAARAEARERDRPDRASGGWTLVLLIAAVVFMAAGVVASDPAALVFAGVSACAAALTARGTNREKQRRRRALLEACQKDVLQLARDRGGLLTVSETAASLGWTITRAERVLISIEDGFRVRSEVTRDGRIVYEFPELLRAGDESLASGDG